MNGNHMNGVGPGDGGPVREDDGTIRLNWREKLVEGGSIAGVALCGVFIGTIVFLGLFYFMRSTLEAAAPGSLAEGSIPVIILVILSAAMSNTCAYISYPYVIRLVFRGYELNDKRIERSLKRLISVSGLNIITEKVYGIRGRTANAAVAGLFRKSRYIFFTDKLLERMNEEEIMAIFAHELAHAKHKHLPWMILAAVLWVCAVQVFFRLIDFNAHFDAIEESWKMWVFAGTGVVNVYLLMFLVMFPLSRRHEYQADATAARWVGVDRYRQAIYRLYQLNDELRPPRKVVAKLATHPPLRERLERLEKLER